MTTIKPHHFMDIIKLYGSGLDRFVPDTKYGHDFYRVGNEILENPQLELCLTVEGDDICTPCLHRLAADGCCDDGVSGLPGYSSKDDYNKMLDRRILAQLGLHEGDCLTAAALCELLARQENIVHAVWDIEPAETTGKRDELFRLGCKRYLHND